MGISLATPAVSQTVFDKWFSMPQFIGLLPIPVACAYRRSSLRGPVIGNSRWLGGRKRPTKSLTVIFVGVAITLPAIIVYTVCHTGPSAQLLTRVALASGRQSCTVCSGAGRGRLGLLSVGAPQVDAGSSPA